ncbi:MAG: tetratricopeptide repeat protein [Candidatus Obscuribacterales bacterium]|nr:tetratricopeptide repeat protein [Candidatus Obscuribacterales bacterium]
MKRLIVGLATLIGSTLASSVNATESAKDLVENSTWQKLMNAGEEAFKLGKYHQAEVQFATAASAGENYGGDELSTATSLMRQADTCCKEERFETADKLYQHALTIRESKLGPNHIDVMEVLQKQADLELRHRNFLVAEELYKRVLENKGKGSEDNSETALLLKNIAHCKYRRLYDQDPQPAYPRQSTDYLEAETMLNRALAICEKTKRNNPDAAKVLDELGSMYWEFGELSQGEQAFRKALEIRDQTLDSNDPDVESNLQSLIGISTRQGKDQQTKVWYTRLEAIWQSEPSRKREMSLNKHDRTIQLNNRGVQCLNMGDIRGAEHYFKEALLIDPNYTLAIENLRIARKHAGTNRK